MKVGFVLEGGAMRGIYTAGVLDILMDNEIPVDGMIGVSAGCLFGVNYLSRQRGRALRYNLEHAKKWQYMGLRSLLFTGNLINKDYAYYKVPLELDVFDDKTYQESGVDFYATATNVETGKADYIKIDSVFEQMEVLRATSAMPYLSKIVEWQGNKYLDGCVADSVPLQKSLEMDFDRIVVILTKPAGYRMKPESEKMARRVYGKYPNFAQALIRRHKEYNETMELIEELEKQGKIFVLRPSQKLELSKMERKAEKITQAYELGVSDTKKQLQELKKYLN